MYWSILRLDKYLLEGLYSLFLDIAFLLFFLPLVLVLLINRNK